MAAMPSPSSVADTSKANASYDFDPSISEEERRFYLKAYPTVDGVRERKVHCTVCKTHIGTAPMLDNSIKMHPILRVTHCMKCHDFYNSGEFSKGEDGSELYCRWCGQGGEVYCCSSCPYVFCKSCIVKNLSKGVVADIEQNENWNCFSCAPKILWPLRAQHWALMNYIEVQKKEIVSMNLPEHEYKVRMAQDRSKCCRLAKSKCGNMSDSMESLDSVTSKRSQGSSGSAKKAVKHPSTPSPQQPNAKRPKTNDEVVCTPDLLSMLEPDCQITVPQKNTSQRPMPQSSTPTQRPLPMLPQNYSPMSSLPQKSSVPPPLVLRNTAIKLRAPPPVPIVRRTVIGPRTPSPGGSGAPVYHTINGYRIDLNSAAQQDTFRLPNGKLIQVKRQGQPLGGPTPHPSSPTTNSWQIQTHPSPMQQPQRIVPQTIASRPVQITPHPYPGHNLTPPTPQHPPGLRFHSNVIGNTTINAIGHSSSPLQVINGQIATQPQTNMQPQGMPPQMVPGTPLRPVMVRHIFPDSPIGSARSQLQEQVFNAMEICTHLTNKVQTLTNSNAYKQARNYMEVKELYIHLSYLLTYAIGRFKGLQDKCLADMRKLGFGNDADSLENGQLAADKQASDDEDNEIEIVEPKTDLINLDSDDDDEPPPPPTNKPLNTLTNNVQIPVVQIIQASVPNIQPTPAPTSSAPIVQQNATNNVNLPDYDDIIPATDNLDLMSMAQSFLASMLEVDINEGSYGSQYSPNGSEITQPKKQPRKKLTNKPNPTLLKQKARMERERLAEMKRNDLKLKMECAVKLQKAEYEFPYVKDKLQAQLAEKQQALEKSTTVLLDMGKGKLPVQLVIVDESINSSAEDNAVEDVINISGEEDSPQKKTISIDDSEDDTDIKIINAETDKKNTDEDEKYKEKIVEGESADKVEKLVTIKENGKDIEETHNNLEKNEVVCKKKVDLNIDQENNADGSNNEAADSDKISETTKTTTDQLEESKNFNSKSDENEQDIIMADVERKESAVDEISDKELGEDVDKPMEVDSAEEQSLSQEIKQIDEEEPQTKIDKEDGEKSSANVDRKSCIPEAEDDEVYKEIEKVLQHRRDSESDNVVKEKEIEIEKEKEKDKEKEKEKEKETVIEPEPEPAIVPEEQTDKEPRNGSEVTEVVNKESSPTAEVVNVKDSSEPNKECNIEKEEENSVAAATQDGIQKQCTSSPEVTPTNGKV